MSKRNYAVVATFLKCMAFKKNDCINFVPDPEWGDDTCLHCSGIGDGVLTHRCRIRERGVRGKKGKD
jgi:hypothetical protein